MRPVIDPLTRDINALDSIERHIFAHRYALTKVGCAAETTDPDKAAAGRGEMMAIMEEEAHELLCCNEMGELLTRLVAVPTLDPKRTAQVKVLCRDRAQQVNVPASLQSSLTKLTNEAQHVWGEAKRTNDWSLFAPYLDKIIATMTSIARHRDPSANAYDLWLDTFEQGTTCEFYDSFFEQVKECIIPLVAKVKEKGWQPDSTCVEGTFDVDTQWELGRELIAIEGVDMDAIELAHTEHPFSDGLTTSHAFIASHPHADDLMSNVYSMLHEGGHAMYELGVNPDYDYTSLQGGTSMGMHESQSRFFENCMGRSEAFATPLLALLNKKFPGRFDGVTAHDLFLAVNRSEPSLIRIEADELTYPLHIIIRYEIERMLFSGEAKAADVPALWAERYKKYLGIDVPDDTHGCLQDVHWSMGSIGYFPTYALGSAFAAQLLDAMCNDIDFDADCAAGDTSRICEWLRSRVWDYGRSHGAMWLVEHACGEPFDAKHYTDYLTKKFTTIYDL